MVNDWQSAEVVKLTREGTGGKTFWLALDERKSFRVAQQVAVRLTDYDGRQAIQNFWIASSPLESGLAITVEQSDRSEVSEHIFGYTEVGDELEVSYPTGGQLVWDESNQDPVLLIAGGSGIVPLGAIFKHHQLAGAHTPMNLLYSARSYDDLFYKNWLNDATTRSKGREVHLTLTNQQPAGWDGFSRRIDAAMLEEATEGLDRSQLLIYICGPTPMVEVVSQLALTLFKLDPLRIKTERFGPTGAP